MPRIQNLSHTINRPLAKTGDMKHERLKEYPDDMFRSIRWVEDTLVKDGAFSLPGRKALLKSETEYEVALVDATETPVERPKKTAEALFWQEKAAHDEDAGGRKEDRRKDNVPLLRHGAAARLSPFHGIRCPLHAGKRGAH